MLHGRDAEQRLIESLLADARDGRSAVIVILGEPGIGKTALLRQAADSSGMAALRCTGVEAEQALPFAGLHQLLRPCLRFLGRLPEPQAAALRAAFGLSRERVDDQLLVSLATLSLLAEAAAEAPLLCVVDDAQWLDPASAGALLFTARRLYAESLALLVGVRTGDETTFDARGLPELRLEPLADDAARALLETRLSSTGSSAGTELLLRQAAGNPLALLELTAAGAGPLESSFRRRITALPERTRRLLLVAAAGASATESSLAFFELAAADAEPAAADALMRIEGGSFVFRHPLVRSAAYAAAAEEDRRHAHRMLAELAADEVERAWHLSAATVGRDDHVAAAMEEAGTVASKRAAFGPALQAYARSASLSTVGRDEVRRLRLAAEAAVDAGLLARAAELATAAEHLAGEPLEKARILAVRANVENARGTPDAAHELFSRAAASAGAADARYACVLIVSAVGAALLGGWPERAFAPARDLSKGLPRPASPEERFVRAFLEGVCALFSGASDDARQHLEEAVGLRDEFTDAHFLTRVGLACVYLGDVPRARECYERAASSARASGSFAALPLALLAAGQVDIALRSLASAENNAREGLELTRQLGQANFETCFIALLARVEAYRGNVEECRQLAAESLQRALAANVGLAANDARLAAAELELGLGAGAAAREELEQLPQEIFRLTSTPDFVEAALLEGAPDMARQAVAAYGTWTRQAADPYLTALATRCEAQLAGGGEDAEPLHRKAVELMTASHAPPFERARTELVYGEYLRRGGHKALARAQLRNALSTFEGLGTPLWSARARAELEATGITTRKRDPSTLDTLTPQEVRIARLVAAGATNRDVAAQLFLSPKTVEYHLGKVFHKLGVSSRVELARQPLDRAQLPAGASS